MGVLIVCDECKTKLSVMEINHCHSFVGYGYFCWEHMPKQKPFHWSYSKSFDKDRFSFEKGIR